MKSDFEHHDLPRFADLDAEYEILQELGRGGTAVVYLARERELGRRVAIKVIRATFIEDEEAAARLVREARTVASLQHPNIVMLHGTRRLRDNSLALIMQYVPGHTLKKLIQENGPLPFARVRHLLTDLGRALACAQRHRIVHRDIKPENIYLDEATGIALLSDFGIARPWDVEQNLTLPGMAIGTPAYMSPEQIEGTPLDGRSDLYSLGLVGYEMLTGRAPWAGESLFSMIYKQKHEALPPLEELRPGIPAVLRRALEGTFHKNREDRWNCADDFLAALNGQLAAPERRTTIWPDSPAPAPPQPPDNVTMQFRRPEPAAPADESSAAPTQPATPPVAPETAAVEGLPVREAPAAASSEDAGTEAPIDALPPEPFVAGLVDVPVSTPAGVPATAPDKASLDIRPSRRRIMVLAAAVPLILASTALFRAVNARSERDDVPPTSLKASSPAPTERDTGAPFAAAPDTVPALAWALLGDRQSGLAGDTLAQPLMVQIENASGGPVAGVAVHFEVAEGQGAVDPGLAVSDQAGVARTRWLLRRVGSHTVTASIAQLNSRPIQFTAQALPRPPARISATSPTDLKGTAGSELESPLVVRVTDDRGDPVGDAKVAFTVRTGEGRITAAAAVTGRDGTVRARWLLGPSGPQEVVATLVDLPAAQTVFRATSQPNTLTVRSGLSVGGMHTCALAGSGAADCWGSNEKGQLGDGSGRRSGLVRVAAPEPLATISAGVTHACGVGISGTVFCWGGNAAGQLGDGSRADRTQPVRAATDERMVSVFSGMTHTCALDGAGRLYCWGQNTHGQLGDGTRTDRATPVRAAGERTFRTVALGWSHTCALAADGSAFCWGRNAAGELGDGTTIGRASPAPVTSNARFAAIAAGSEHTCAITGTGTVLCWGRNSYGQLGNNTTDDSAVPVVAEPTDFYSAIALGSVHSCALTRDGSARCWGRNTYGQLGDGTTENRWWPTPVTGNQRFNTLQARGAHTCAATASTTFCWGYNIEGQLGNGTRSNQTRPVAVNRS